MADLTVIATAAISGGVGFGAAWLQAGAGRHAVDAERARQHETDAAARRRERQKAYQRMLDVLMDWSWNAGYAGRDYDVVEQFNKPFLAAANRVRMYGSPRSVAAVDAIQEAIAQLNHAEGDAAETAARETLLSSFDGLFDAARADVGPRPEDGLEPVTFQRGAGPRA